MTNAVAALRLGIMPDTAADLSFQISHTVVVVAQRIAQAHTCIALKEHGTAGDALMLWLKRVMRDSTWR